MQIKRKKGLSQLFTITVRQNRKLKKKAGRDRIGVRKKSFVILFILLLPHIGTGAMPRQ
jgi:hypothetical protein